MSADRETQLHQSATTAEQYIHRADGGVVRGRKDGKLNENYHNT